MVGQEITWDKFSLKINHRRRLILAGEFHYWRVPDGPDRWVDLLRMYKAAGLNAVRIYYHWGYHSPADGEYNFEGNRDIEYLHRICEDLGLYVLAAPGPYICSETQAGGFPTWLVAKREINIKHLKGTGRTKYDPEYMKYCKQWLDRFLPLLKPHQITENPLGCVVALQIENEYFERLVVKGSRKYMEQLVEIARENEITVPNFHNDGWEKGSWEDVVDLYGFDKYPIHAPKDPTNLPIPQWESKKFMKKVDGLEDTVRGFGSAADTPIFIPELQGGWFNHWGIPYGFDALYDFYGPHYQKMLVETLAAEGSTMWSLYMFYGGTNWGALADPDVYTSYDYAACIREFGFQSDRLKQLRLFLLFARSFEESFAGTYALKEPSVHCDAKDMLIKQRIGLDGTEYNFFRNFNPLKMKTFGLHLADGTRVPKTGTHELEYRDSFIAIGNHELDGFRVKFCSLPIIVKGKYGKGTLLALYLNGGELLLKGTGYETKGDIDPVEESDFTRFTFSKPGYAAIQSAAGKWLYILAFSRDEALNFNADLTPRDEIQVVWGPYSSNFLADGSLEIEAIGSEETFVIAPDLKLPSFQPVNDAPIPGIRKGKIGQEIDLTAISFNDWKETKVDWYEPSDIDWREINFKKERDPLDFHFTSGHVAYKCEFHSFGIEKLSIKLNVRHKCAIWMNGKLIGGHDTYAISNLKPGAKTGPDPSFLGTKKYDLTGALVPSQTNTLIILTESLGQNRIPFVVNDVRNPRGILSAKFSPRVDNERWFIAGIDVTTLDQPFNTSGLPGEKRSYQKGEGMGWKPLEPTNKSPSIAPEDHVKWIKTQFQWNNPSDARVPLRLHLEGKYNANVFLNDMYVGRYWGEMGPQHDFYLMDYLLAEGENQIVMACWTIHPKEPVVARINYYQIDPRSGNLNEKNGIIFSTSKSHFTI